MTRVTERGQTLLQSLMLTDEIPELPEDIWLEILLQLPTKDLVSKVALVCREFRGRVRQVTSRCFIFDQTCWSSRASQSLQATDEADHQSQWKCVARQATSKLSLLTPAYWSRRGSQIASEKLHGMYMTSLQPYIECCTCLRVLVIHPDLDIIPHHLTSLLKTISQLEHLSVLDIRSKPKLRAWSDNLDSEKGSQLSTENEIPLPPSLQVLRTDTGVLGRLTSAAKCKNLLYIQDALNHQEMSLEKVIEQCSKAVNLRVLKLRMSFQHVQTCQPEIWNQLHTLNTLDLNLGRRMDITARLIETLCGLKMLKVLRVRQVNIKAKVICTFAKLLNLEELELSFYRCSVRKLQKLLELPQIQRLVVYIEDLAIHFGLGDTQKGAYGNLQYFQLTVGNRNCPAMLFTFTDYVQLPSLKRFILVAEQMSIDIKHVVSTFKKVKVRCRIDITSWKYSFHEHDCNLLESVGFVTQYYSNQGIDMLSLSYVPNVTTSEISPAVQDLDLVLSNICKDKSEVLAYRRYLHDAQEKLDELKDDIHEHWKESSH